MTLFDTHCHLDNDVFEGETEKVIKEANADGVLNILIPACGFFNWEKIESLVQLSDGLYFSLGLHPYFVEQHTEEHIALLKAKLEKRTSRCVAIGECGLDFYHSRKDEAFQKRLLIQQIELANLFDLPVILHSRKAHQEIIKILKQYKPKRRGVIHGFTGSYEQAMDFIRLGFFIGVGGSITYERAKKTRQAIASIPLSSIVLETDAPDMPLSGYQGLPNHPKHALNVLRSLNMLRSETEQTVASAVFVNSKRLFNICK